MNHTDHISKRAWHVLLFTGLAVFMVFLDTTVLFIAFSDMSAYFNTYSISSLSWIINGYTIIFCALLVPAGLIADRLGHKKLFLLGVILFTLASLACGLSHHMEILIIARIIQGIGAALTIPTSLTLVLQEFPQAKKPIAISLWSALAALAGAIGPSLGSMLVNFGGWSWVFFINIPVGIIAWIKGRSLLEEFRIEKSQNPDLPSVVLLIASISVITLAILKSHEWGFGSNFFIYTTFGGILLLLLFVLRNATVNNPAIDFVLFRNSNIAIGNLASLIFGVAFTMMFFGMILFLIRIWHYSIMQAGISVTPGPLMVIPVAFIAGKMIAKQGFQKIGVIGGVIYFLGALYAYIVWGVESNYLAACLPALILTGIGVGLLIPALSSASVLGIAPHQVGTAVGINQATRQLGGVFGVALVVTWLSIVTEKGLLVVFDWIFIGLMICGLVSAALLLLARSEKKAVVQPIKEVA